MFKQELPRVKPEQVGISSRVLLQYLKRIKAADIEMHGLMIARHGKVCLEHWWAPYTKDTMHTCHSLGKSYVGTAIGVACTQGILSLNDRIVDIFADDIKRLGIEPIGNISHVTVEHVLMMANGMSKHPQTGEKLIDHYLTSQFDEEPGTIYHYNTAGSCMLGAIITRITGRTLLDYLTEYVFTKIGIEVDKMNWMTFKNGLHAAPGVATTTENNLRLALLYLQNGRWNGQQIIDEEWIRKATTKRIDNYPNSNPHPDYNSGYGYQLWMCAEPDCFRFAGGQNQDAFMCRKNDLVIATHEAGVEPRDGNSMLDIITELFLHPDLPEQLPDDPTGYAMLCDYLQECKLPDWKSSELPEDVNKWEGIYQVVEGRFHIEPELHALGDKNLNSDFFNREESFTHFISIQRAKDGLDISFDFVRIFARFDGKLVPVLTRGAMPPCTHTISVAYFKNGDLFIDTRYLQTEYTSFLRMHRTEDGMILNIRKESRVIPPRDVITNGIVLKKIIG